MSGGRAVRQYGVAALQVTPVVAFSSQPDVRLSDLAAADRLTTELALRITPLPCATMVSATDWAQ